MARDYNLIIVLKHSGLKQNYLKNDQDWFQLFDVEYLEERNAHTFGGNELSMVNLNFLFL